MPSSYSPAFLNFFLLHLQFAFFYISLGVFLEKKVFFRTLPFLFYKVQGFFKKSWVATFILHVGRWVGARVGLPFVKRCTARLALEVISFNGIYRVNLRASSVSRS